MEVNMFNLNTHISHQDIIIRMSNVILSNIDLVYDAHELYNYLDTSYSSLFLRIHEDMEGKKNDK